MRNFIRIMNLVIVLECLIACGHKDSSDSSSSSVADAMGLTGTWVDSCQTYGKIYSSSKIRVVTSASDVVTLTLYTDPACTSVMSIYTVVWTYSLGEELPEGGGRKIDLTLSSEMNQMVDPAFIKTANANAWWGYTNWAVGQTNSVMDRADPTGEKSLSHGEKRYDIVKISGNKLYYGDTSQYDGTALTSRPVTFESTYSTKK